MRLALATLIALTLTPAAPAPGQQAEAMNEYTLSWSEPGTHLYDVSLTFAPDGRDSVDVHLPVWRPGRYVRQNYAANVQEFSSADEDGDRLPFRKSGLSTWRVAAGGVKRVTVRYRYYANTLDAGASLLAAHEAYFNPVNLFMYPDGQIAAPLRLTLKLPRGWKVATALTPTRKPNVFTALDYHTLADSPTIASPSLETLQFTVDDVPYTLVFQGRFEPGERRSRIVPDVEKIVRVQTAIFGNAPFDEYFFLFHLVPYPFGHAVEHANSSSYVIQDNAFTDEEEYTGFLDIVAHELFHAWNVKRIRPAALWPYDYSREQFTTLHWFTEGVTSYYAEQTLLRAGHVAVEQYLESVSRVIDQFERTPGRKVVPVSLASWDSWLSGYGQGNPNTTVSFYAKGMLVGLLLDGLIRDATDGARSLDDVLRLLYATYYQQGKGVPEDGVKLAAESVAGRSFEDFFARYVQGTEELPYDEVLRPFGLRVSAETDPTRPEADLRIQTRPSNGRAVVLTIDPESPALAAGLDTGDELLAIDESVAPEQGWESLLMGKRPGETLRLTVLRRNQLLELQVKAAGGGNVRRVLARTEQPDERQDRLFNQWTGSPAEEKATSARRTRHLAPS